MNQLSATVIDNHHSVFHFADRVAVSYTHLDVYKRQYSPYAVAEYTVALMLSLNRKIPRAISVKKHLFFTFSKIRIKNSFNL